MFVQKVPHIKDQFLTQERASMELESGQIAVGWYTNEQDSQSVVHSHPYYELVLPLVGSNVRYSVDGNIYDINLGEMIIFPARCYHAGMFNITDKISERLIAQIDAELWQEALLASGLVAPTWLGQLVILDADAVTAWDLRGLFERMAQTAYLHGSTQHMVQRCELVELLLLMDQIVAERRTAPPSATSALVAMVGGHKKAKLVFAGTAWLRSCRFLFYQLVHGNKAHKVIGDTDVLSPFAAALVRRFDVDRLYKLPQSVRGQFL